MFDSGFVSFAVSFIDSFESFCSPFCENNVENFSAATDPSPFSFFFSKKKEEN